MELLFPEENHFFKHKTYALYQKESKKIQLSQFKHFLDMKLMNLKMKNKNNY